MISSKIAEKAIIMNRPGEPFVLVEKAPEEINDLSSLDWQADTAPPTWEEVSLWVQELQTIEDQKVADETANQIELATYKLDLVTQYQAAVTRLDAIVTNGPTYTAAQTRDAVVDMAKIQRAILKLVKKAMT